MKYVLRDILDDELKWLYDLNKEAYHDVVIRQFGEWDEAFQQDMFYTKWASVNAAKIVELEGQRVGVVILEQQAKYYWLEEIQISGSCRGRGLGTAILKSMIDAARRDRKSLRLQVLHENKRAKSLYERLGFRELEKLEHHFLMEIS